MVKAGLLMPYQGPGTPWRLTDAGWEKCDELLARESSDPFSNFQPKDDADYRARIKSKLLVKRRSHESLITDFGKWSVGRGFVVETPHPRDLVLRKGRTEWLVEGKVLYGGNAAAAVRAALAQLLMYRHFLHGSPPPKLAALFSAEVGDAFVRFPRVPRRGLDLARG
jgi:hypothetical protein